MLVRTISGHYFSRGTKHSLIYCPFKFFVPTPKELETKRVKTKRNFYCLFVFLLSMVVFINSCPRNLTK